MAVCSLAADPKARRVVIGVAAGSCPARWVPEAGGTRRRCMAWSAPVVGRRMGVGNSRRCGRSRVGIGSPPSAGAVWLGPRSGGRRRGRRARAPCRRGEDGGRDRKMGKKNPGSVADPGEEAAVCAARTPKASRTAGELLPRAGGDEAEIGTETDPALGQHDHRRPSFPGVVCVHRHRGDPVALSPRSAARCPSWAAPAGAW
ncbi:MAG: hypothetical protein AVDCRST_MAG19-659 [uncultured Thermomicrobiales bacterium]|uniref:Uncharacterized protein n=1 Tax=uncultured Thermomicrobiales bacterium TaxID=1645740 RepID=A0A6J4UI05_9BACT|nr:MAG: hypothetical protein AVDCRST_MAG19-659 [uncultured Thermomicrobiales bacterium]